MSKKIFLVRRAGAPTQMSEVRGLPKLLSFYEEMKGFSRRELPIFGNRNEALAWLLGKPKSEPSDARKCVTKRMKIRTSLLVIASLAVCVLNFAAAQNNPDTVSSKILTLERQWNTAYKRSDIAGMDSLLADDFIITVEDGSTFSKSGYIAHNGDSTVHVGVSDMSDLKVRLHGNTVVVTVRITKRAQKRVNRMNTATVSPMFG